MNNKECEFQKEYNELLSKYNVSLLVNNWSDEYGSHSDLIFKEIGEYCSMSYHPKYNILNNGHKGMGS